MSVVPGTAIGRYRVETVLGQGGMATVYRVRHVQLGSRHALKVLTLPAASIRERLLQEGRVQATLKHPNIVTVTDVVNAALRLGIDRMEEKSAPRAPYRMTSWRGGCVDTDLDNVAEVGARYEGEDHR